METTKKRYVIPSIERTLVETEGGFCENSGQDIVDTEDPTNSALITVTGKEVGAESDYFGGTSGENTTWDY